jgi:hypothetical protein
MMNIQGDQAPAKQQKILKNWRTHPWRLSPSSSWARRHLWYQLWSLPVDVTENLNMHRIAAKFVPQVFTNDQINGS